MKNPKLLIHIGYPKTASTWLQQVIFSDEKTGFLAPWGAQSDQAIEQFVIQDSFHFSAESARQVFEPGLQEAAQRGLLPILSQEFLSCNPLMGRDWGKHWGREVAQRIHSTFPEALIFIVIREQKSIVYSSYKQHIKMGGTAKIEEFLGKVKSKDFNPICRLDFFDYDLLIEYYQEKFSCDNVLVLPFELLQKEQKYFCKILYDFVGLQGKLNYSQTSKNVGYKGGRLVVQRQLNFFCKPRPSNNLTWLVACKLSAEVERFLPQGIHESIEKPIKEFIAEYVGDSFRESNQRTSRLIGVNLADFGYAC